MILNGEIVANTKEIEKKDKPKGNVQVDRRKLRAIVFSEAEKLLIQQEAKKNVHLRKGRA